MKPVVAWQWRACKDKVDGYTLIGSVIANVQCEAFGGLGVS